MPLFEQRPPRIEAILYDGTNAADAAEFIGGSVGDNGELVAPIYGPGSSGVAWFPSYLYLSSGEVRMAAQDEFEAIWRAV